MPGDSISQVFIHNNKKIKHNRVLSNIFVVSYCIYHTKERDTCKEVLFWRVMMRKEENIENIEKEDLCSKLQVHFIENTEAEKSVEDTASTDQISTDSSVKPEECSKRMNKNNSENDAQEAANEKQTQT